MSIWKNPITKEELNQRSKNSLSDHLEIVFTEVGEDYVIAKMPINHKTLQPMGIMHGGASCALAETVASAAANYCIEQTKFVCIGLEINTNHIRTIKSGFVIATAKPVHLGKSTQVWEILIQNEKSQLISINRLTLMVIDKK